MITLKNTKRHGTTTAYKQGCRCDECRAAKSADNAKYQGTQDGVEIEELRFSVSCRHCGGRVVLQNSSPPSPSGGYSTSILKCVSKGCRRGWQVTTTMRPLNGDD